MATLLEYGVRWTRALNSLAIFFCLRCDKRIYADPLCPPDYCNSCHEKNVEEFHARQGQ